MLVRFAFAGLALSAFLVSGLRLNSSPSMPLGIYWLHQGSFPTQRGQIVFACPRGVAANYLRTWEANEAEGGACPGGLKPFVKYAAALPGDIVVIAADGVHVNGAAALRGSVQLHRVSGVNGHHAIPALPFGTYRVPAGTVWLYAPQWYSFDSRYYGALPASGVAQPLLVHSLTIEDHAP